MSSFSFEFYRYRDNIKMLTIISFVCMFFLVFATTNNTFNSYGDSLPIAFAMSCASILIGLMISINMVCKDYYRVYYNQRIGISAKYLVISRIRVCIVLSAVMSLILILPYTINIYEIDNQSIGILWWGIFFTMFSSSALGLFVSTIWRHEQQKAALSIPYIMIFQILFSGFIFDEMRLDLSAIAISNYSIRIIGTALRFDNHDWRFDAPYGAFVNTGAHIGINVIFLGIFLILATISSGILLWLFDRK